MDFNLIKQIMKKGTVKEFDVTKGYGFIKGEDNEDYFVHISGLR